MHRTSFSSTCMTKEKRSETRNYVEDSSQVLLRVCIGDESRIVLQGWFRMIWVMALLIFFNASAFAITPMMVLIEGVKMKWGVEAITQGFHASELCTC